MAFTEFNVYPVDESLSMSGVAADAKKTGDEISLINEEIDNAPSEDTGADLLAELMSNTGLTEIFLEALSRNLDNLPQEESGQVIIDALTLEADRMEALYELWKAERSA